MSGNAASAGSWTMARPPASFTAMSPAVPSSSRPLRITPTTRRATGAGRRAEQRVDGGPQPMLFRPMAHLDPAVGQGHMGIWGLDEDAPRLNGVPVLGVGHRQGTDPGEDPGPIPVTGGREVLHDKDRRRQVGGQAPDKDAQRLDPAGGGADHDDVTAGWV